MRDDPALVIHDLAAELGRAADLILGERYGISFARYRVLRGLRRGGTMTQHALAESLGIGDASISRVLPALVERRWCLVEDDPSHGRRRRVRLTPAGADLERDCATALADAFHGATCDAGIDAAQLVAAAEALTARLRAATGPAADR